MTDTVGFINRLPHQLVASFRATLEEAQQADLLLRVVDLSLPNYQAQTMTVDTVLKELGITDEPMLDVAIELERIALSDDYFIEKKLYPNIDFYSGITLKAIGFPTTMFTALFALARTTGWVAQWNEMIEDPSQRIGRPRQVYAGHTERNYIELAAR